MEGDGETPPHGVPSVQLWPEGRRMMDVSSQESRLLFYFSASRGMLQRNPNSGVKISGRGTVGLGLKGAVENSSNCAEKAPRAGDLPDSTRQSPRAGDAQWETASSQMRT